MRRASPALLAAAAVLALAAVLLALPWLTERRTVITSTPVPPALDLPTAVRLAPGRRVCVAPVTIPRKTAVVVLRAMDVRAGPALRVTLAGEGYASSGVVAAGYGEGPVTARLAPPPRDVAGRVCVADAGDRAVALHATIEPRRPTTTVDGRGASVVLPGGHRFAANLAVTFAEDGSRALSGRTGELLGDVTAFRPAFVTRGLVAALLLALVALAVGVPRIYSRALAGDERARREGATGS
jgi:hypothetical protein